MTAPVADIFALTPAQAGLLLGSLAESAPGLYVVQMRFSLAGQLDSERLEHAWKSLLQRHPAFRTAVSWERSPHPVNVVLATADMPLTWLDLRGHRDGGPAAALEEFLQADKARGFDLARPPLSRVTVLQLGEHQWEMVWTHHHVILDGWSTARLIEELWQLYIGAALAPTRGDFAAHAARLAAETRQHRVADAAHWRERLADGDARVWADRPRDGLTGVWTDHVLPVDQARLDRWSAGARRHGVTVATLHHGAWALTLREAGLGPDELVLGTVADTRGADESDIVGMCVASVPLRVAFEDGPVTGWLRGIAVERAAGQEHGRANLAEHREWSSHASEQPFRYLIAIESYPQEALVAPKTGAELIVRYLGVHESTEYALTAGVPAGPPCLKLTIDTRRVSIEDARHLVDQWAASLDLLAACPPDLSLREVLTGLSEADTGPHLAERIEQLARTCPHRPAFRDATREVTFAQLNGLACGLAARLRHDGVAPGDRVAVLVDDSVWVAVSVLGVLIAGAVVVPLDPRHPAPFRAAVLDSAGVSRIVTSFRDVRPEWAQIPAVVASDPGDEPSMDTSEPDLPRSADAAWSGRRLAFLVHDAGSALRPVAQVHDLDRVLGAALAAGTALRLNAGDDWVVTRPATGVGAPWEMWTAPLHGGCTVLAPGLQHRPDELLELCRNDRTTIRVDQPAAPGMADILGHRCRVVWLSDDDGALTLRCASGEPLGTIGRGAIARVPDPAIADVLLSLPEVATCEVDVAPDGAVRAVVTTTSGTDQHSSLVRALRCALPEDLVPELVAASGASVQQPREQHRAEEQVSQLWSAVLGLAEIPRDTAFFDLGGHSLQMFAVLRGLRDHGWVSLTMTDLLAHPTVRSLGRHLAGPRAGEPAATSVEAAPRRSAGAARRERGRT